MLLQRSKPGSDASTTSAARWHCAAKRRARCSWHNPVVRTMVNLRQPGPDLDEVQQLHTRPHGGSTLGSQGDRSWRSTRAACEDGYQQVFGERIGVRKHLACAMVFDVQRLVPTAAGERELEAIFTGGQAVGQREPILAAE